MPNLPKEFRVLVPAKLSSFEPRGFCTRVNFGIHRRHDWRWHEPRRASSTLSLRSDSSFPPRRERASLDAISLGPSAEQPSLTTRSWEDGITRFADESRPLPVWCGKGDRDRWSDAGRARSDLTPGGVRRMRASGGRSAPGLLRTQQSPEGPARGHKPHGRVDDRALRE